MSVQVGEGGGTSVTEGQGAGGGGAVMGACQLSMQLWA